MRKTVLAIFILLFSMSVTATQDITTCEGLQEINNDLEEDYVLTDDIDCGNIGNFEPIGDYSPNVEQSSSFKGTLDGQEHVIRNLEINNPEQSQVGLFSGLEEDAEVQNLKIVDSSVIGKSEVGGIAGRNDEGTIRYVGYEGEVSGQNNVGGITGWNEGTVDQTYTTGRVGGQEVVGGIVGRNFASKVVASYSTSNVSGENEAGGVIGSNLGTSTQTFELFATGTVEGSSQVGGIAGEDNSYGIQRSYWDEITTTQDKTAFNNEFTEDGALSTDQMTGDEAVESMSGLGFGSTWSEPAEGRYPYLNAIQSEGIEPVETSDSQDEDQTNSENDENEAQETGSYDIQVSYGDNFENGVGNLRFTTLQSNSNEPKRGKWELYDGRTDEGDILAASASGTLNWETLIYREEYCEDQSNLENQCEDSESKFPKGPGWYTVKFTPADSMAEKTKSFETGNREESTQNEDSEEENSNSQDSQEESGSNSDELQVEIGCNSDSVSPGDTVSCFVDEFPDAQLGEFGWSTEGPTRITDRTSETATLEVPEDTDLEEFKVVYDVEASGTSISDSFNGEIAQENEETSNEAVINIPDTVNLDEEIEADVTVPEAVSSEYQVIVTNPSGEEIQQDTYSDVNTPVDFIPRETGEYRIEVYKTGRIQSVISRITGALASETFRVEADQPEWINYCRTNDYKTESIQQKANCIQDEIIPKYFEDSTGSSPEIGESLCQDLLGYSYSSEENSCIP